MAPREKGHPTTYVLFVRHGMTPTTGKVLPGRAPGLHLTEAGRAEAAELGRRLGDLGRVRALYSSPIERAVETADEISRGVGVPVEIEPGLIECDFGVWTGAGLHALRSKREWRVVLNHPSGFRFPGGESFVELQARVLAVVERLMTRHRGEVVVAVSHADPIKVALGNALGSPLDFFQRIVVGPCSTSIVAYRDGQPWVLATNTFDDPALVGVPSAGSRARGTLAGRQGTAPGRLRRRDETGSTGSAGARSRP